MITYTDDDKTVLLLASRVAGSQVPAIPTAAWWGLKRRLDDEGRTVTSLLEDAAIADEPERIEELAGYGAAMGMALETFLNRGILPLPYTSERFPARMLERLGERCPPVLFVAGDVELVGGGGLGVVGSRDVDEHGAEVATAVARGAARRGIPVISGAARGVDQLAMSAASEAGGAVVGFVADALTRRLREPATRHLVLEGSVVLVSAQHPDAPFSAGSAMARNKLIYAASDATFVVASARSEGGTWAGASESLRYGYAPVLVHRGRGEGPGNAALVEAGAQPVGPGDDIFAAWPPAQPVSEDPVQESLFG